MISLREEALSCEVFYVGYISDIFFIMQVGCHFWTDVLCMMLHVWYIFDFTLLSKCLLWIALYWVGNSNALDSYSLLILILWFTGYLYLRVLFEYQYLQALTVHALIIHTHCTWHSDTCSPSRLVFALCVGMTWLNKGTSELWGFLCWFYCNDLHFIMHFWISILTLMSYACWCMYDLSSISF